MNKEELNAWLFEHGGPVIRYRTATELMEPDNKLDLLQLRDEMMQGRQVKTWLERLVPPVLLLKEPVDITPYVLQSGIMELHGSQPTRLENVLGKLTDFGVKKGIPELDQRTLPYREWLAENAARPMKNVYGKYNISMLAAFLARAGYANEPGVEHALKKRLNMVYDFTRKGDYDIYVPNKFIRKHPLIKLEVTPNGDSYLPLIYDIIGWSAYLPEFGTEEERDKADTILRYILNAEYQKLPLGYGVMGDGTGRTWSLGWSVPVPRYFDIPDKEYMNKSLVQMISLLIDFQAVRQSPWLKESMDYLESYRTEQDTYLFPANYLEEKTNGYWVNGVHMSLEEKRKRNLELESTFWMVKFQKLLSQNT